LTVFRRGFEEEPRYWAKKPVFGAGDDFRAKSGRLANTREMPRRFRRRAVCVHLDAMDGARGLHI